MGPAQMQALERWLLDQQKKGAVPKFVVSPSVVAPWSRETRGTLAYSIRSDDWDGYPDSVAELLHFIARERIENVVFLSGDLHASMFCRLWLSCGGGPEVSAYSVVSSGLYSPYPFANTRYTELQSRYDGLYRDWIDAPMAVGQADLRVRYETQLTATRESFAVLAVERSGNGWLLSAEFDVGSRAVPHAAYLC